MMHQLGMTAVFWPSIQFGVALCLCGCGSSTPTPAKPAGATSAPSSAAAQSGGPAHTATEADESAGAGSEIALKCSPAASENETAGAEELFAEARQIFQANCVLCHSIAGQLELGEGYPNPAASSTPGPDLAKVGADPEHSVEWLMRYIRNPKSVKPKSRMPPFEGRITDENLKSLVEFLSALK